MVTVTATSRSVRTGRSSSRSRLSGAATTAASALRSTRSHTAPFAVQCGMRRRCVLVRLPIRPVLSRNGLSYRRRAHTKSRKQPVCVILLWRYTTQAPSITTTIEGVGKDAMTEYVDAQMKILKAEMTAESKVFAAARCVFARVRARHCGGSCAGRPPSTRDGERERERARERERERERARGIERAKTGRCWWWWEGCCLGSGGRPVHVDD